MVFKRGLALVNKELPQIKAYFAGRNMSPWFKNNSWDNVDMIGEVDDSILFMSSKKIMVVPLCLEVA